MEAPFDGPLVDAIGEWASRRCVADEDDRRDAPVREEFCQIPSGAAARVRRG